MAGTKTNPVPLTDSTWGYALPGTTGFSNQATYNADPTTTEGQATLKTATFAAVPATGSGDTIMQNSSATTTAGDTTTIYYGARVDDLASHPSGNYTAGVTYTATANLPAAPTITKLDPNTINTGETKQITITGTNLASTYQTFIDLNNNGKQDSGEQCASPTVTDTTITCTASASSTPVTYKLYVLTQADGGEATYDIKYQAAALQATGTMQDPDISKICQSTTTPNASATQIDSTGAHAGDKNYVPEVTMTDIRDNNTYKVRKLADGNCWMVENLALGTTNSAGVKLTNQDTDLHSQTSFTLPAFSSAGNSWSYYDNTPYIIQGSTANGGSSWKQGMGNWYTWGAATANTAKNATSDEDNATDSICPNGWQLPDNDSTKSYYNLITTTYKQSTGSAISQSPLSFTYAGLYNYSGGVLDVGSYGVYWSSTAYSSDGAYRLSFGSSNILPLFSYGRGLGFSVRCVVR